MRRSPLKRSPMKRTRQAARRAEVETRATVAERSEGQCEIRLDGCAGAATDMAHRVARGMGGRPLGDDWRASNVVHSCRVCHSWCHANPAEAYDLGLMLKRHQDPTREPLAYFNVGWVLLDDLGGLWPVGAAA
jgi:hypothetical protein